jgi:hypothetical protein
MKSVEDALDLFVWEQTGKREARMIIDSDVETFDAGAWIAHSAIACGADARTAEAAQFLDVEMEELAWVSVFIADDGRSRFQSGQTVEAVAAQNPRDGGLGDLDHGEDLGVGAALAA